jgi:hypothetical protein
MEISQNAALGVVLGQLDPRLAEYGRSAEVTQRRKEEERYSQFADLVDPVKSIFTHLLKADDQFVHNSFEPETRMTMDKDGSAHVLTLDSSEFKPYGVDLMHLGQPTGWRLTISLYHERTTDSPFSLSGNKTISSGPDYYQSFDFTLLQSGRQHDGYLGYCLYSFTVDSQGAKLMPQTDELPGSLSLDDGEELANPKTVTDGQFEESIGQFRQLLWQMADAIAQQEAT